MEDILNDLEGQMLELNKVYQGDCLEVMKEIDDDSIDLTVTSPPYDNLRTYNNSLIWGESIWKSAIKELYRVTKRGGIVVWVVGDAVINGSETGTSFKQALYFKEIGFNLHDTMIYEKHNFSNPSNNRYHQIFEYMFIFSKGKPKTFNPIKDKKNVYGGKIGCYGKNTIRQKDGSFKERDIKINSEFGMRLNIWRINTEMKPLHPAQFPYQLAHDHIISWSNEGDIVLDPFAGSGTTGIACLNTNRNYILIEKEQEYVNIIKERIKKHK